MHATGVLSCRYFALFAGRHTLIALSVLLKTKQCIYSFRFSCYIEKCFSGQGHRALCNLDCVSLSFVQPPVPDQFWKRRDHGFHHWAGISDLQGQKWTTHSGKAEVSTLCQTGPKCFCFKIVHAQRAIPDILNMSLALSDLLSPAFLGWD